MQKQSEMQQKHCYELIFYKLNNNIVICEKQKTAETAQRDTTLPQNNLLRPMISNQDNIYKTNIWLEFMLHELSLYTLIFLSITSNSFSFGQVVSTPPSCFLVLD